MTNLPSPPTDGPAVPPMKGRSHHDEWGGVYWLFKVEAYRQLMLMSCTERSRMGESFINELEAMWERCG